MLPSPRAQRAFAAAFTIAAWIGALGCSDAPAGAGGAGGDGGGAGAQGSGGGSAGTGGTGGGGSSGGGGAAPSVCDPIAGASYGTLPTAGQPTTSPPPAQHGDINVKLRGWESVNAALDLVDYGGATDAAAPKLNTMFADDHVPAFVDTFAVHEWDWATNTPGALITDWPVTMIAMASAPGEPIELPRSGYDIGQGLQARVLFADDDSITLKYTLEDNVVYGYTVHVVGVCVEPSLRALYEESDAAGRAELPALAGDQAFGRARGASFLVAIRDTGAFMDPRSQKDWW